MSDISQGARANLNGKIGETTLEPLFTAHGYTVMMWSEYNKNQTKFKAGKPVQDLDALPRLVLKQVPYDSIYHHNAQTEFVIYKRDSGKPHRTIRVEVKWQQSAGSVDEKYPYVYLNSVYQYPEHEIVIIIDGNGYKEGALNWIKDKADKKWLVEDGRSIKVMNLAEFMAFFNKELL